MPVKKYTPSLIFSLIQELGFAGPIREMRTLARGVPTAYASFALLHEGWDRISRRKFLASAEMTFT